MDEPKTDRLHTPAEARKVLNKAKRDKKKPSVFIDVYAHTDDGYYYPLRSSVTLTWPQAERLLKEMYQRVDRLNSKDKPCKIRIDDSYDRLVFIG